MATPPNLSELDIWKLLNVSVEVEIGSKKESLWYIGFLSSQKKGLDRHRIYQRPLAG